MLEDEEEEEKKSNKHIYLGSWILDAKIHLDVMNLGNTIKGGNTASLQDRAKALIFLRHHIDEGLKNEYLTVKDPLILWTRLKQPEVESFRKIIWKGNKAT